MATPGYPQQMPPMGPPMMGAPMMPPPRPIRRGTSKAVPIVVSAGLAVGVFCGLLFGVGTGDVSAGPSKGNNVKKEEEGKVDPNGAPKGLGATATVTPKAPPPPPPAPAPPPPKPKLVKVIVTIEPEAAAKVAKISVDGQEITGNSTDIPPEKKNVKIEVKAPGFKSTEQKVDILEGDEMTLKVEMAKKPTGGGSNIRPPKRIDKPPGSSSNSNGGIIDI